MFLTYIQVMWLSCNRPAACRKPARQDAPVKLQATAAHMARQPTQRPHGVVAGVAVPPSLLTTHAARLLQRGCAPLETAPAPPIHALTPRPVAWPRARHHMVIALGTRRRAGTGWRTGRRAERARSAHTRTALGHTQWAVSQRRACVRALLLASTVSCVGDVHPGHRPAARARVAVWAAARPSAPLALVPFNTFDRTRNSYTTSSLAST
jgi:hypothetical protein